MQSDSHAQTSLEHDWPESRAGTNDAVATAKPSQLRYMPGIDGLRAMAVLAVLFYHADMPWMPGGFLGVEVFFAISGYLITGLLLAEWHKSGLINLGRFWFRRARRLLPAVYTLLIVVLAFTVIVLPGKVASLRIDALGAALYVNNWVQIFSHKSYFEAIGRPSLLRHLWSLAVEEQFYIVWPVLLVLVMRFVLPHIRAPKRRLALAFIALAGVIASSLLMAGLYNPDLDPSRIYYGTDTRAAGFLIGATLAILTSPAQTSEQIPGPSRFGFALDVLGFGAVGGLTAIFILVNEINQYLYLGGFAVVSLLTVAAIYATVRNGSRLFTRLLSLPVVRWVGLRSYSIYLWHWPIYAVTRPQLDVPLTGLPLMVLRLAMTAVCAELSYRLIERPIREGALGRLWSRLHEQQSRRFRLRFMGMSMLSGALLLALGAAVIRAQPPAVPPDLAENGDTAGGGLHETATLTVKPPVIASRQTTAPPAVVPHGISMKVTPTAATTTPMVTMPAGTAITAAMASTAALVDRTPAPVLTPPLSGTPESITDSVTLTDVLGANYHITAIGDSVMKGAASALEQAMGSIDVDAVVARQAGATITLLRQRRDAGTLGNVVIVHIGNNGFITPKQYDEIMSILSSVPRVIIVNVHVPRRWEGPNNTLMANEVLHSKNALLVDWYAATVNHPEYFAGDGLHMQPKARMIYVNLIMAQIKAPYLAQIAQQLPPALQAH